MDKMHSDGKDACTHVKQIKWKDMVDCISLTISKKADIEKPT
jgi:hypothetical protein